MIVESIFNVLFGILTTFFEFFPDVNWSVDSSFFTAFFDVLSVVCYFLPMTTVRAIFSLVMTFTLFRILVSLIKTVWQLIPFF